MSTSSLRSSLHHYHCSSSLLNPNNRLSSSETPPTLPSSLFLKPSSSTASLLSLSSYSSSSSTTFSVSTSSANTSTSNPISFDLLEQHLSNQDFRQADEETRRLLILLAGEAAQKRGYVFFSEVQFISQTDLKAIDDLWRLHSDNKFGYSVQRKIWQKVNKDFTKFFLKVGWMKKLDTEVEQYNYRSFPNEFMWELNDETPQGHLPLTNALRGTQLLNSILSHPAFEADDQNEETKEEGGVLGGENGGVTGLRDGSKPLADRVFKPDYSF